MEQQKFAQSVVHSMMLGQLMKQMQFHQLVMVAITAGMMWMRTMIWWIWTAFNPHIVHVFDVDAAWSDWDDPDVYWLGESAWVDRIDNTGVGLR